MLFQSSRFANPCAVTARNARGKLWLLRKGLVSQETGDAPRSLFTASVNRRSSSVHKRLFTYS
jgi:hypothetical protein